MTVVHSSDDDDLLHEAVALRDEIHALKSEVSVVDNKRRAGNIIVGSMLVLLAVAIVVSLWVGYQVYDCTVDGGNCYKKNREATGQAIVTLQHVIVASNVCSSEHTGEGAEKIEACVADQLRAYGDPVADENP